MRRGRWIAALALLLALGVGWYVGSPWWTLHRMQAAVKADDADALVAMVDFPTLREDMKAELMARMIAEAGGDATGAAKLGLVFGSAMIGPMIDGMITPVGIRAAFLARGRGGETGGGAPDRGPTPPAALKMPDRPVIVRRGLSEFLLASDGDRASGLVFRRAGLGWKLAGIDLPATRGPAPAGPTR